MKRRRRIRRKHRAGERPPADGSPRNQAGLSEGIAALGVMAVVVVGSMLAIGTVHTVALLAAGGLACVGAVLLMASRAPNVGLPGPALLALALALYSMLQTVPLPFSWLGVLSPHALEVWLDAYEAWGVSGNAAPVSLDPPNSAQEAFKWLSYGALFVIAAAVGAERGVGEPLLLVLLSGALLGALGWAHDVFGVENLYGVYEPLVRRTGGHVAPLLNPNNLGGYCMVAALCGLGLLVSVRLGTPEGKLIAVVVGLSTALCIGGVILASSRAALGLLLASSGALLLGLWVLHGKLWRRASAHVVSVVGGVVVGGAVIGALTLQSITRRPLLSGGVDKLLPASELVELSRDHAYVGVGRGAFGAAYRGYRVEKPGQFAEYAENLPMQWLSEWGAIVAWGALFGFAILLRPGRLGAGRSPAHLAAFIGVFALLVQNLVDLSLELPSVVYALICVVGGLWGSANADVMALPGGSPLGFRLRRVVASLLFVASCVLAWGVATTPNRAEDLVQLTAARDRARGQPQAAEADIPSRARAASLRHPAEPYFYQVAAERAVFDGDDGAPLLLGAALRRAPGHGGSHLLTAVWLGSVGDVLGALPHLRKAVKGNPQLVNPSAALALAWTTDEPFDALMRTVPDGAGAGVEMLSTLALRVGDPVTADRLLREALTRAPASEYLTTLRGQRLLDAVVAGAPPCDSDPDQCVLEATELAAAALEGTPRTARALYLQARILEMKDGAVAADDYLSEQCPGSVDTDVCTGHRLAFAMRTGREERARRAAAASLGFACSNSARCARAASSLSLAAGGAGLRALAMEMARRAAQEEPTEARLERIAALAEAEGSLSEALQALGRAARLDGPNAENLRAQMDELRRKILEKRSP